MDSIIVLDFVPCLRILLLEPLLLLLIHHVPDQSAGNHAGGGANQRAYSWSVTIGGGADNGAKASPYQRTRTRIVRCAVRIHTSCRQQEHYRHNGGSKSSLHGLHRLLAFFAVLFVR